MQLSGTVTSGLGRAHVFMAQSHYQEQFKTVLGSGAWPGTHLLTLSISIWPIAPFLPCLILFCIQILITACLVIPFKQCKPLDVQTSLFLTIKKFVELHVETKPCGSSIKASSTSSLEASIHAAIQLCLLNELI